MSKKTIVKVILKTLYFRKVTNNVMNKNDYLIQYKLKNKWSPKSENRKSSPCSIFGDTFTINTLQLLKHIKDSQILI